MSQPPDQDRLERLEASVTHLERLCEQLNSVVIEQHRRLARLQKHLDQIARHLESGDPERPRIHSEKPPHWAP